MLHGRGQKQRDGVKQRHWLHGIVLSVLTSSTLMDADTVGKQGFLGNLDNNDDLRYYGARQKLGA